jgi:hypothetical protein
MSSTEDDEPPPKKARPEAKPAKMVAPPGEWSDFLELEEYPLPAGHVRAMPMGRARSHNDIQLWDG